VVRAEVARYRFFAVSDREREEHGLHDVEELEDDVIVAQETGAHAPAPRVEVATDPRSIVISDVPGRQQKLPTVPPLRRPERTEKTVVIRDRKSLDKLRRGASRPPRARRRSGTRMIYLVGVAVLASLAAGTLLATLTNSIGSEEAPSAAASIGVEEPTAQPAPSSETPAVVDLADLPAVKKTKKKKPAY
jgi:hypothetical protein